MQLSGALRVARQKRGWSQFDLALHLRQISNEELKPHQSDVSDWERGLMPGPLALRWLQELLPELRNGGRDNDAA